MQIADIQFTTNSSVEDTISAVSYLREKYHQALILLSNIYEDLDVLPSVLPLAKWHLRGFQNAPIQIALETSSLFLADKPLVRRPVSSQ